VGTKSCGFHPFGQYTDDTQLARELLRSLVERRRFDPADYAARIARLFTEGHVVGQGRATEAAADRLAAGVPWDEAGTPSPAAGNGSAMRAAPIGLMLFDRGPTRWSLPLTTRDERPTPTRAARPAPWRWREASLWRCVPCPSRSPGSSRR